MAKTARSRRHAGMAKRDTSQRKRCQRALTLKLDGQLRPGRIGVRELIVLCQQAQSAIDRQAEALEGRQTLRPGRKLEKVHVECTLELASLRKGSTMLGFDLAKPQQALPTITTFGEQVLERLVCSIESVAEGSTEEIDPGVLDSLNTMGEILNGKVRSITWTVPSKGGGKRKRRQAVFDKRVRRRLAERLKPPSSKHMDVEGVVEMADFKPADYRCRIHPVFGPPITCAFDEEYANRIHDVLRKPARLSGEATYNAQTGTVDVLNVTDVTPLEPLQLGARHFGARYEFDQLAKMQAVEPLLDVNTLAGGWPDDEEVDQALADIYAHRE